MISGSMLFPINISIYVSHLYREARMNRQYRFRPTSLAERARFVWLWQSGLSARAIAQENRTSVTTVFRWIRRWKREGNVYTKPRSGRPRSTIDTNPNHLRKFCVNELGLKQCTVCLSSALYQNY